MFMTTIEKCKIGFGVTFTVAAIALTAITAIAVAVIFAPPFFASALLAGCATYVAIGCGAGALIATISALFLLLNRKDDIDPYLPMDMRGPYRSPAEYPAYLHYTDAIGHHLLYTEVNNFKKMFNDACNNDQIDRSKIEQIVTDMDTSLNKTPFSAGVFVKDYYAIKASLAAL
jgi:hypothetical protein